MVGIVQWFVCSLCQINEFYPSTFSRRDFTYFERVIANANSQQLDQDTPDYSVSQNLFDDPICRSQLFRLSFPWNSA